MNLLDLDDLFQVHPFVQVHQVFQLSHPALAVLALLVILVLLEFH